VYLPTSSCDTICANVPAERTRRAGPWGESARLWTTVPVGISWSGRTFPGLTVIVRSTPIASAVVDCVRLRLRRPPPPPRRGRGVRP
jgi:hypothetical protein